MPLRAMPTKMSSSSTYFWIWIEKEYLELPVVGAGGEFDVAEDSLVVGVAVLETGEVVVRKLNA